MKKGIVVQLFISAVYAIVCNLAYYQNSAVVVGFLDVGQGDSSIIISARKEVILIDGGPDDSVLVGLGEFLPSWVRKIDVIILTHPHADHVAGLVVVAKRYEIGMLVWNPVAYFDSNYCELAKTVKKYGIIERRISGTESVALKDGLVLDFWAMTVADDGQYDNPDLEGRACVQNANNRHNINNDSVVVLVRYGSFSVLYMGDAEIEAENLYLDDASENMPSSVTILKAGHHCSRTASGARFLTVVKPQIAICSVGRENTFGHPHSEVLERFLSFDIAFERTDEVGSVIYRSNGSGYSRQVRK